MTEQPFSLLPFLAPNNRRFSITGKLSLQNHAFTLHYFLAGSVNDVLIPAISPNPSRKDALWESTCFEFFLAIRDLPEYWEFNLSPSGDWNVYHMDAYRRVGFKEETAIQRLQIEPHTGMDGFALNATVDLKPILRARELLEVGISAILELKDGSQSFWALTHPAAQPDFHWRESFLLALAAQTHPARQSHRGD